MNTHLGEDMSMKVFKAIKMTQMENELLEVVRDIKYCEAILNSTKTFPAQKKLSKKKLIKLAKRKKWLTDQITEGMLL